MVFSIFLCMICLISHSFSWNTDDQGEGHLSKNTYRERILQNRSSEFAPIRVTQFYLSEKDNTPELVSHIQNIIFPSVNYFLQKNIKVKSVIENIKFLTSSCDSITPPKEHKQEGVANTDFILYIKFTKSQNIIKGISCQTDPSANNIPVIGIIWVGLFNQTDFLFPRFMSSMFAALGFYSNPLTWTDSSGLKYVEPISLKSIRGKNIKELKTPNVVSTAKEVFKCDSLTGVELEDNGSPVDPVNYWEKRIMYNDIMTNDITRSPIISKISLAVLKDTGWYDVDFSRADTLTYGTELGCAFFEKKCTEIGFSNQMFCSTLGEKTCDFYSLHKSVCTINTYADSCALRTPLWNGNCRAANPSSTFVTDGADEVIGPNSHCFESTLNKNALSQSQETRCYEVTKCSDTEATVKIGQKEIKCPFTGATIEVGGYYGVIKCPNSKILCTGFPCIENCLGYGTCFNGVCSCDPGYSGNYCQYKCGSLCKTCGWDNACLSCLDENAEVRNGVCACMEGKVCSNCLGNCNQCTSYGCTSCNSGYLLNDGVCEKDCGIGCIECTIKNYCTQCSTGYFLSSFNCQSCPLNCKDCTNSKCKECAEGFQLIPPMTCSRPCSSQCIVCDTSKQKCSNCRPGYFVNSNGLCEQCAQGCELCKKSSKCTSCYSGYKLKDKKCKLTCPSNCDTCTLSSNSTNSTSCTICNDGYYLNNSNCFKCSANCELCSSDKDCTSCKKKYELADGFCKLKCTSNCTICKNSKKCLYCNTGYTLDDDDKCKASCTDNCEVCSNTLECVKCKKKFSLINGKCTKICSLNCKVCKDIDKCTTCNEKFYLDDGKCYPCSSGCKQCPSNRKCNECAPKFYLSDKICVACFVENCDKCDSAKCLVCSYGFYLSGGACIQL